MARPQFVTPEAQRYIDQRLPALVGDTGAPEVVIPATGVNSECYILRYPLGGHYVLRVFERPRLHSAYRTVMLLAARHELPMPRMVASEQGLLIRMRYSRTFLLEEFVTGELLMEAGVSDKTMAPVLDSLARMHDVRVQRWGYPKNLKTGSYRNQCLGRVERILAGIPADSEILQPGEADKWAGFVRVQWRNLPEPEDFCPVHHHLAPDDIMISLDQQRAMFLDNGALRFGHFAHDLEDVLAWGMEDGKLEREALKGEYFKRRKTLPAGYDYTPIEPFFHAEHCLKKVRSALRKLGRGDTPQRAVAEMHAERMREVVASVE
ncbi:aminoglycoside phosphotransferase family protein [bacterium]|nr:aminoglycoside phosphotransferase family protein [bacterium]